MKNDLNGITIEIRQELTLTDEGDWFYLFVDNKSVAMNKDLAIISSAKDRLEKIILSGRRPNLSGQFWETLYTCVMEDPKELVGA